MKTVLINPDTIDPISQDKELQFKVSERKLCEHCGKHHAMWIYRWPIKDEIADVKTVCSRCMIYQTPWGRANREAIMERVKDDGKGGTRKFELDDRGQMDIDLCNRVMGSIVIISKRFWDGFEQRGQVIR